MKAASFLKISILSFMFASIFQSCLKEKEDEAPSPNPPGGGNAVTYDWNKIADSAQLSMNYFWSASDKVYLSSNTSTNWGSYWPNAHALDVLVDAYIRTPSPSIKARMDELLTGVKAKNGNTWLNYYYDDMEWMALACLRAFQATNDNVYKDITAVLWTDIKNGWSAELGGGIWWRKDNPSKNTPSNMPAAVLAARLYKAFNNADDLDWAKKIFAWQKSVLYEPATGWVYDNIDKAGNKNQSWRFTYNQGAFLGAALELYKITGTAAYKTDAIMACDYAVSSGQLTSSSILKDEGGGDGGLFKGVFVRYFTKLIIDGGSCGG
jgi:predicted alpha-1,6-mannanase (GH76 family)